MRLLQNERRRGIVLLCFFRVCSDLRERIEPDRDLVPLQLVSQDEIFLRLFRLLAKRLDLHLQLGDLVADAQEIVLGRGKAALGLLFSVAVFGDAGSLFKNFAAVGRFLRKDLVDSALADVGVTFSSKAGIHEKLVDIAQTRRLLVDVVLALARTVVPAGDHDLGRFDGKRPVLIV